MQETPVFFHKVLKGVWVIIVDAEGVVVSADRLPLGSNVAQEVLRVCSGQSSSKESGLPPAHTAEA